MTLQILLDHPDRTLDTLGLDRGGYLTKAALNEWDNFDNHSNWDNWRNR